MKLEEEEQGNKKKEIQNEYIKLMRATISLTRIHLYKQRICLT